MKTASQISLWIESHRRKLPRGGSWLLGGEPNMQSASEFSGAEVKILVARLSGYHEVAAGITHSFLWQLARTVSGTFVDLAFFPPALEERAFTADEIPLWFGTTTREPPTGFDLIAISNSVVQELLNLPAALAGSGIPLDAVLREQQHSPLVVLGGSNSYATGILHGRTGNTEKGCGLVDVVLVGDAEHAWPMFIDLYKRFRTKPRKEFLREAARTIPGCFVPGLYQGHCDEKSTSRVFSGSSESFPPIKSARADLSQAACFCQGPIFYDEDTAGTSHLLISAGCPYFCSFCKESWEQKPYRERDLSTLCKAALQLKIHLGLHQIGLMTFNVNTATCLNDLLERLEPQFERIAIKSQRFDAIAQLPHLLERQLEAGKRTYTCAMEGISDRLRRFLQKGLSEKTLLEGFRQLFQHNLRQMKVFLIVTGNEREADLKEFSSFLSRLKSLMANLRGKPILTFSLAALFRPPFTPLQFEPMRDNPASLETWSRRIEEVINKSGFECRISAGPWDALVSEFIAYADFRSTPILVKASVEKRFRYRGEIERSVYSFWKQELRSLFPSPPFPTSPRTADTMFPWKDIDTGISQETLYKNYQLLLDDSELPTCIAPPLGSGICQACGACPDSQTRKRLTGLAVSPPSLRKKEKVSPIRVFRLTGRVSRRLAPVGNRFLEAAFTRLVLLGSREVAPELAPAFGRFTETLPRGDAFGLFQGDFTIAIDSPIDWKPIIPLCNTYSSDLEIFCIRVADNSLTSPTPDGLRSCFHLLPGKLSADVARDLDALLVRYRIKHLKCWEDDLLNWEIAPGQAKKFGFSRIQLPRSGKFLFVQFLNEPEPHLLSFFSSLGDREIEIPAAIKFDSFVTGNH